MIKAHNINNMEMPVICTCGEVFDLNDGYGSLRHSSNRVICTECHQAEKKLEKEMDDVYDEFQRLEDENKKPKTREKLYRRYLQLREELQGY